MDAPGLEHGTIYPVPIRENMAAKLHLPNDLTLAEAEKICAVIRALATVANPASPPNEKSRPVSRAAQVREERRTTGTRV